MGPPSHYAAVQCRSFPSLLNALDPLGPGRRCSVTLPVIGLTPHVSLLLARRAGGKTPVCRTPDSRYTHRERCAVGSLPPCHEHQRQRGRGTLPLPRPFSCADLFAPPSPRGRFLPVAAVSCKTCPCVNGDTLQPLADPQTRTSVHQTDAPSARPGSLCQSSLRAALSIATKPECRHFCCQS